MRLSAVCPGAGFLPWLVLEDEAHCDTPVPLVLGDAAVAASDPSD